MEPIYTEEKEIKFYHCDSHGELLLPTYLSWTAEISGQQLETRSISRQRLWDMRQLFLLSQVSVRVLRKPKYDMHCRLSTWEYAVDRVRFFRNYCLEDAEGPLCESTAAWILTDPVERRILRSSEYAFDQLLCDRPVSAELSRLRIEELPETAVHTVRYSQLDGNGHLNNSHYGAFLLDYAPAHMLGTPLTSAEISFMNEALPGQQIRIHTAPDSETSFAMYGILPDGRRCFNARAEIENVCDI